MTAGTLKPDITPLSLLLAYGWLSTRLPLLVDSPLSVVILCPGSMLYIMTSNMKSISFPLLSNQLMSRRMIRCGDRRYLGTSSTGYVLEVLALAALYASLRLWPFGIL